MQDLNYFLSPTSNFIDYEELLCCLTFLSGKTPAFLTEITYSTFNLNEMTESECLSEFRFGKRDILMG